MAPLRNGFRLVVCLNTSVETTIEASDTLEHQPLRMRTAISPGQWKPWTAVSALLGLVNMAEIGQNALRSLPFTAEAGAKHSFKRQLHTTQEQFFWGKSSYYFTTAIMAFQTLEFWKWVPFYSQNIYILL